MLIYEDKISGDEMVSDAFDLYVCHRACRQLRRRWNKDRMAEVWVTDCTGRRSMTLCTRSTAP